MVVPFSQEDESNENKIAEGGSAESLLRRDPEDLSVVHDSEPALDLSTQLLDCSLYVLSLCKRALREVFLSQDMRATRDRFCTQPVGKFSPVAAACAMINMILLGVSQVYICEHPFCGLLIAIAVGLTSGELLLHCLLGVASSTAAGYLLCRLPFEKIKSGLLGYDGALVGCTVWTFLTDGKTTDSVFAGGYLVIATVLLSAFAGMMHMTCANLFALVKLPPFTAAFNIVCLTILAICARENINSVSLRSAPVGEVPDDYTEMSALFLLEATFRGVGQFIYADTTVGGALVVLGVMMQGRDDALCLVLGSFTACLTARYVVQVPQAGIVAIRQGLYGYNSAGVCVVLGGGRFYRATKGAKFLAAVGAMVCVFVQIGLHSFFVVNEIQLPVMTFPFIVTSWIMMYTESGWIKVKVDAKRDEDRENVAPTRSKWKPNKWKPKLAEIVRQKSGMLLGTNGSPSKAS